MDRNLDALPLHVKSLLSSRWLHFLEMLSNYSISTTAAQKFLNDTCTYSCHDNEGRQAVQSWEEFLLVLSEPDAVIRNGALELQPIFFSLPPVTQTKLLFCIHSNSTKIAGDQLHHFVTKVDKWIPSCGNHWVIDGIARLMQDLGDTPATKNQFVKSQNFKGYVFSSLLEKSIDSLTKKIKDIKEKTPAHAFSNVLDISAHSTTNHNSHKSVHGGTNRVVDVIVINDEDSQEAKDLNIQERRRNLSGSVESTIASESDKDKAINSSSTGSKMGKSIFAEPMTTQGSGIPRSRKRSFAEVIESEQGNGHEALGAKLSSSPVKPCIAKRAMDRWEEYEILDSQSQTTDDVKLSDDLQAQLLKFQELCAGEKRNIDFDASKLRFLTELSSLEVKVFCDNVKLESMTDEALVSLCDAAPWDEMDQQSAQTLISGCLFHKLLTLETEISQALQAAITSVLERKPQVVLDLIVKVIAQIKANDFQCQALSLMCKKSLSKDSLGYLLRQLITNADVEVNENLISVFQAVMNRPGDLDPSTVTSLVTLLGQGGQTLAQSLRFGKSLMACLTKFGKKMTDTDLTTFSSLVDVHSSNLKTALKSALKRLNV